MKSLSNKTSSYSIRSWSLIISSSIILFSSCRKEWLDVKPEKSLAIPKTLQDCKALLSSTYSIEPAFNDYDGWMVEYASGDFYVRGADLNSASTQLFERNIYSWKPDVYEGQVKSLQDWNYPYLQIYYSNIVLEAVEKIQPKNQPEQNDWNHIKGTALFFRALGHYNIARQFCKPYITASASSDPGIPLRLSADFNEASVRSSVNETYTQIIEDLKQSVSLLPISTPDANNIYKWQPNKAGVYAMLARVYLSMSDYQDAYTNADKSLGLYNKLYNYNDLLPSQLNSTTKTFESVESNPEILFNKKGIYYYLSRYTVLIPDSNLYAMYVPDDIRRDAFFQLSSGQLRYTGSYCAHPLNKFTGLATDEVYLIRAECHARLGHLSEALADLNTLLIKRWKTGTFTPVTATDANDALTKILLERRKELCFRGLRWEDLRRLNQNPQTAVTLTKYINGQTYTLPPNSNLYVFPIPDDVIRLTGMSQNPR